MAKEPHGRTDRRLPVDPEAAHEDYEAVLNCGAEIMGAVVVSEDFKGDLFRSSRLTTWSRKVRGSRRRRPHDQVVRASAACSTAIGAVIGGKVLHEKSGSKIEEEAGNPSPSAGPVSSVAYKREARTRGPRGERAGGEGHAAGRRVAVEALKRRARPMLAEVAKGARDHMSEIDTPSARLRARFPSARHARGERVPRLL